MQEKKSLTNTSIHLNKELASCTNELQLFRVLHAVLGLRARLWVQEGVGIGDCKKQSDSLAEEDTGA